MGPDCGKSIDCAYGCGGPDCEPLPQGRPGWSSEAEVADTFQCLTALLWDVLRDGGRKRDAGVKPHWSVDESHIGAMSRHLDAWALGPVPPYFDPDPDSGAHPLVHAAARALMIAAQELGIARQR